VIIGCSTRDRSGSAGCRLGRPPRSGTVELYGFAPLRTIGTTTIRGQEAEVDQDLGQILDILRFAASARGSIEKNLVGLQADLWYTNLGDSAASLVGPRQLFTTTADVGQTLGIYDVALRYRFGERESAIGKPGAYSVIPYAGIRLIDGRLNLAATLDGPFGRTLLEPSRNLQRTWVQPLVGTQANGFSVNMNVIEVGVKFFFGGAPRGTAVASTPATQATPTAP